MSQELSPSEQQELFALLLLELRRARESALADGVDAATFNKVVDERQRALMHEDDKELG